jgi:hypothetical protein
MRRLWLVVVLAACEQAEVTPADADVTPMPSDLEISPGNLGASSVIGLPVDDLEVTVTNSGAGTSSPIEASISGTTDFTIVTNTCGELASRRTCRIVLRFTPSSVGAIEGMLTVSAASGGSATAALHGVGKPVNDLRVERSTLTSELGYAAVGHASTRTITFTISTVGAVATGPLTAAFADQNGFVKRSDTCTGQSLAPGATCAIEVGFEPVVVGQRETYLRVMGNPGGELANHVQGIGVATDNIIEITPSGEVFADTAVSSTSAATTFTITNTGSVATSALGTVLTIGDTDQFRLTSNGCADVVLQPAGTCVFALAFAPTSTGQKTAGLTVTGAGNPAAVTVIGMGI